MSAQPPPHALWQVTVQEKAARVELWEHPNGWECRVFSQDRLCHSAVFSDVRLAHVLASSWLALLIADVPGGGVQ